MPRSPRAVPEIIETGKIDRTGRFRKRIRVFIRGAFAARVFARKSCAAMFATATVLVAMIAGSVAATSNRMGFAVVIRISAVKVRYQNPGPRSAVDVVYACRLFSPRTGIHNDCAVYELFFSLILMINEPFLADAYRVAT